MRRRHSTLIFHIVRETKIFGRTKFSQIADVPSFKLADMIASKYVSRIKATTYRDVKTFVIPLVDKLVIYGGREKIIYFDFVKYALKITNKFLMINKEQQIVTSTSPKNGSCINEYNCWKCIFYTVMFVEVALIWVWFFGIMPDFTQLFM